MQQEVVIPYWQSTGPIFFGQEFFLFRFLTLEDTTDRFSWNNGKELPVLTV
jgi:hypothetical protein